MHRLNDKKSFYKVDLSHNVKAFLKIFEPQDAPQLFSLVDKNRVSLGEFLPWVPDTKHIGDSQRFIEAAAEKYQKNSSFDCGIWLVENLNPKLVGSAGLHPIDWHNKSTAIGYWLGAQWRGNGFITESVKILLNHAFSVLELNRVEIRCSAQNVKSQKIPESLKFQREGVLRQVQLVNNTYHNHVVYSMLKSEWIHLKNETFLSPKS
jgi:ribosomal-protein-serine acetyltransferase